MNFIFVFNMKEMELLKSFSNQGILPILCSFPSYVDAIRIAEALCLKEFFTDDSKEYIALQNHFTFKMVDKDIQYFIILNGRVKKHRANGPATIAYSNKSLFCWYWKFGVAFRKDGPCFVQYSFKTFIMERYNPPQNNICVIYRHINGKLSGLNLIKNKKHNGPYIIGWYESGIPRSFYYTYKDHQGKTPAVIIFNEKGEIQEEYFADEDGNKHGPDRLYSYDRGICIEYEYIHGRCYNSARYYPIWE